MATKKLTITEEAYEILLKAKRPEESLSDCILRKYGKEKIVEN